MKETLPITHETSYFTPGMAFDIILRDVEVLPFLIDFFSASRPIFTKENIVKINNSLEGKPRVGFEVFFPHGTLNVDLRTINSFHDPYALLPPMQGKFSVVTLYTESGDYPTIINPYILDSAFDRKPLPSAALVEVLVQTHKANPILAYCDCESPWDRYISFIGGGNEPGTFYTHFHEPTPESIAVIPEFFRDKIPKLQFSTENAEKVYKTHQNTRFNPTDEDLKNVAAFDKIRHQILEQVFGVTPDRFMRDDNDKNFFVRKT